MTQYRFHLWCPRCGKISDTVANKIVPPPHVNCGDCLMEHVEIVEMKVAGYETMKETKSCCE